MNEYKGVIKYSCTYDATKRRCDVFFQWNGNSYKFSGASVEDIIDKICKLILAYIETEE